jgi:hypothetical protein
MATCSTPALAEHAMVFVISVPHKSEEDIIHNAKVT